MPAELIALQADITTLDVDAVVNAANPALLGGGGVDGAIHRAAGPGLLEECRRLAQVRPGVRCPPGEARVTGGHGLAARWVIHTVGPVWGGGGEGEAQTLAACYRSCMALARERGAASIAFPAISTGVYGYPAEEACGIAVREVRAALAPEHPVRRVVFACFDERTLGLYRAALDR
jgi:O-acetyl-ADP-ribose deacetylase (regulator of RNase III)